MLGILLVNLKKTFDTVDHRGLRNKLKLHGVQDGQLSVIL